MAGDTPSLYLDGAAFHFNLKSTPLISSNLQKQHPYILVPSQTTLSGVSPTTKMCVEIQMRSVHRLWANGEPTNKDIDLQKPFNNY